MPGTSHFAVSLDGDHPATVTCTGELDLATVPDLDEVLATLVDDVVVDCERLTFLDSSGIALLVRHRSRLKAHDHDLRLTNVSGTPRNALEITGLHDLMS